MKPHVLLAYVLGLVLLAGCNDGLLAADTQHPSVALDRYGGVKDTACPGRPTGFFRVQRMGSRWVFCTPDGNAYWMLAVYGVSTNDGGASYTNAVLAKYGSRAVWATQAVRRLKSWGFNTIGEYYAAGSWNVLPVGTYNLPANSEKLPFIRLIRPSVYAYQSVKDIVFGTDPVVYKGWRGVFYDVYDPRFAQDIALWAKDQTGTQEFNSRLDSAPWLIGTTVDDTDYVFGLKSQNHAHLGWLVAVTASTQNKGPHDATYKDSTVYTKLAWREFLRAKYKSDLRALNAAWGSSYTTWDSDGGWPRGTGLLDESGRHSWIGRDHQYLSDVAPQARADMNSFLEQIAEQYFSITERELKKATPNHLVFSPAAIDSWNRPEVLRALSRHYDVIQLFAPPNSLPKLAKAYDVIKKPIFYWATVMSQKDSALSAYPGWEFYDHPTQHARGQAYVTILSQLWSLQGSDGVYPALGVDWWAWVDKVIGGEHNNFGLVSVKDNAYDGKEDVLRPGKDRWGYSTGGEERDYGDFLTAVEQTNKQILLRLRDGSKTSADKP